MKMKLMKIAILSVCILGLKTVTAGSTSLEDFFEDKNTKIIATPYEDDSVIKIRATGEQGDRREHIDKEAVISLIKWEDYDNAFPPYSLPVYKLKVLFGQRVFEDFKPFTAESLNFKKLHKKEESIQEDKPLPGEWANMYKIFKYTRPDTTTHDVKIKIGEYKNEVIENLIESGRKYWSGDSFSKFAFRGFNSGEQIRYYNFKADVYEVFTRRCERESEFTTVKTVTETKTEILKNKREYGDEPSKPSYQASWN